MKGFFVLGMAMQVTIMAIWEVLRLQIGAGYLVFAAFILLVVGVVTLVNEK